jgi:hypothetical protein
MHEGTMRPMQKSSLLDKNLNQLGNNVGEGRLSPMADLRPRPSIHTHYTY